MPSEIRRKFKNTIKNYTDAQVKVREATSNDPWGPSSTVMGEIADLTYNVVAFSEIMQMIWKRLNDHGKNWRHVYKSLVLLEYIIKTGSERVAQQCKENVFAIQTLKDFQHTEDNKDQGVNVREKAKSLVSLLNDDERLKNERAKALKAKERFAQNSAGIGSQTSQTQFGRGPSGSPSGTRSGSSFSEVSHTRLPASKSEDGTLAEMASAAPASVGEEELQLQLALAISKEQHNEDLRKQRNDDVRLQMAMQESIKEEDTGTGLVDLLDTNTAPAGVPVQSQSQAQPASDPWGLPAPPGSHHHHQPQHQPPSTTQTASADPWGVSPDAPSTTAVQPPPPAADPWGVSIPEQAAPAPPPTDPWGAPPVVSAPPTQTKPDPWGDVSSNSSSQNPPWGTPDKNGLSAPSTETKTGFDLFEAPATEPGNNGLDNEFDMLSSRTVTSTSTSNTTATASSLFDMDGLSQNMPEADKKSKTPQDFLGANSNLVNLDNLVMQTSDRSLGDSMNPFASGNAASVPQAPADTGLGMRMPSGYAYNPFAPPASQPAPINQMSNPAAMNFQQTTSGGLLPAPLAPSGGEFLMTQPVGGQMMQSTNPFL